MNKKNYFSALVAMFAMISVMILSSCSHDDYYYNEEKAEQALNDQYAIAFEKAFGKVGPNVDWGFGSKGTSTRAFTRAVSDYKDYRGNIQPTLDPPFPSDCDPSNFLKKVPAGVDELPINGGGAKSWYINKAYAVVNTYGGAAKLYVTGEIDLSENDGDASATTWRFMPSNTSEIYLLEGSKLILGEVSAFHLNVAAIYIAEGATLQSDYSLWANNLTKIYNHGTIKVGSFMPNTSSFLYNVGTLEAGSVTAESNPTRIVNDGTVNCSSVTVKAGAVQNNDQWNVRGTTRIESNNSGWVNNGHWTTYNYAYVGGSWNVINNCFLEVTNDFEMNISSEKGAFKIDGGGGVLTTNFYGGRDSSTGAVSGPFVIVMGKKAVFKVTETAQLESGRYDEAGFGIFGPTEGTASEYAVFQAKDIVRDPYLKSINSHGAVAYGGHLYVSAETHFAQGYDSDGTGTYDPKAFIIAKSGFSIEDNIYGGGFKSGKPNITIEETPCCPGFYGDDPNPTYRVIAEDLSATEAGDFDFNDVVFDVEPNEAGTAAKIVVRAAGGIYKLTVAGQEVHQAFGESANANGLYPMINTNPWDPEVKATLIESYPGTFSDDAAIRNTIKGIEIKVYKPGFEENGTELTATTGKAACKILVDKTFSVVRERHSIADENTDFHKYVQGTWDSQNEGFWWKKD